MKRFVRFITLFSEGSNLTYYFNLKRLDEFKISTLILGYYIFSKVVLLKVKPNNKLLGFYIHFLFLFHCNNNP